MATPSEQKALAFVAMIVLLGGVVRVVRAGAPANASSAEQQALARQAASADSAAGAPKSRKSRALRPVRPRKGASEPTVIGGVASVPAGSAQSNALTHDGFPPPSPRVDVDYRTNRSSGMSGVNAGPRSDPAAREPVDLDRATEREIDVLPWVGPALARRIVANRDSFGPFGSIEALGRVKGVGPATRKRLATLVTFSGGPSSRR
ncbi:MAG: ComEA family DNA-binding protein [Gemmatimonadaceae bacterium]